MLSSLGLAVLLNVLLIPLLAVPAAAGDPTGNGSALEPVIDQLRPEIEEMRDASGIPAVQVALMLGGEVIWSEAFGWADMREKIPATPTTRFGIGSLSKTLTLIACARLVDQGRLEWDARIESYLVDFPHAGNGITIRDIGAHLSGMGDAFADSVYGTTTAYTTDEAYREVVEAPLVHDPGEAHLYATGPFTVIAQVIETLEETAFTDVVAREVTVPLGLADTLPNDPAVDIPRRAKFYVPSGDSLITDRSNYSHIMAGGGYLSTAMDLVVLGHAALIGDFLSAERRSDLTTDMKTRDGAWTFFGLGWQLGRSAEWGFFYANAGGGRGFTAAILVIPDYDLVVSACTNLTDGPTWNMVKLTAERVVETLN